MCQDSNLWKKILVNCGTGTDIATQTSQTFTNNKLGSFKLYHNILISLVLNSCTLIVHTIVTIQFLDAFIVQNSF